MSQILCIDTATEICSVALSSNGVCTDYMEDTTERSHAKMLSVIVEKILAKNDLKTQNLDAVAVSEGPGSYTGLRIGVSVAKGICYATGKPLIAVPTLQTIAAKFAAENKIGEGEIILPMLDARRMEVYYARYSRNLEEMVPATPKVIEKNSFEALKDESKLHIIGNGAEKCKNILDLENAVYHSDIQNSAAHMCNLAAQKFEIRKFENTAYFEPAYLKPFLATTPKKKLF